MPSWTRELKRAICLTSAHARPLERVAKPMRLEPTSVSLQCDDDSGACASVPLPEPAEFRLATRALLHDEPIATAPTSGFSGLTEPARVRTFETVFEEMCQDVELWPLPGQGHTVERFHLLARCAARDVVLGRLIEAHADAIAILHELRRAQDLLEPGSPGRWGVWAAGPPESLVARHGAEGWRVSGMKRWCSGAGMVTRALVDAADGDGQRLFAVDLAHPGVQAGPSEWTGPGMRRADTRQVEFLDVAAQPVGGPGDYLSRPGFWAGGIGVAACWHGGATAVADALRLAALKDADVHSLVHVGSVYAALFQSWSTLCAAGHAIDARPAANAAVLARSVRSTIERTASLVIDHVGRALGPRPLAFDELHAQAVHDLQVYIRQDHAERDLERLGRDVLEESVSWPL
jgi:alkylation response protein AidB-like acyl-CoA dehydrogenase